MPLLMLLTLLTLIVIQSLSDESDSYQPVLRAAVIWGGMIVASSELLSLLKFLTFLSLSLFWTTSLLVSIGWLVVELRRSRRLPTFKKISLGSPIEKILLALTLLTVTGVLFVSLKAPVQTYDSLSYHMSRVAHWAQNHSVGIYPTGIERQNEMGPFAEYTVLHLYILQRGDLLVNLVDWLAYLGCILAATFIAGRLGAGRRGQLIAGVFAAGLPMAIAQASSTMTDIVVAFWTMCVIAEITSAMAARQVTWRHWLYLAGATGLAILTKSTAFAFVLPFLIWFGILSLRAQGLRRTAARCLPFLAIVVAVNLFFGLRNDLTFGTPLGSPALLQLHANKIITPGVLVSNVVRNLSLNLGTPSVQINHFTVAVIAKLHKLAGMNVEDPRTTFNGDFSITNQIMMEDRTGNPLQLIFIMVASVFAFLNKKISTQVRGYTLTAISTYLLFSIGNTYQVFGSRLQAPFFLLAAPLVGLIVGLWRPWISLTAGYLLLLAGLPWLFSLQSRPILPIRGQTIPQSILSMSREQLYFTNVGGISSAQKAIVKRIRAASCTQIGLMLGGDDPEYLWWVLLGAPNPQLRIEWLVSGTPSAAYADPNFRPCAVICKSCSAASKTVSGLPLQFQSGDLSLFLKPTP